MLINLLNSEVCRNIISSEITISITFLNAFLIFVSYVHGLRLSWGHSAHFMYAVLLMIVFTEYNMTMLLNIVFTHVYRKRYARKCIRTLSTKNINR